SPRFSALSNARNNVSFAHSNHARFRSLKTMPATNSTMVATTAKLSRIHSSVNSNHPLLLKVHFHKLHCPRWFSDVLAGQLPQCCLNNRFFINPHPKRQFSQNSGHLLISDSKSHFATSKPTRRL